MRSLWSFNAAAYNPFNRSSTTDRLRRICMICTLGTRTLVHCLSLYRNLIAGDILEFVITLVSSVIGFFFIGYCLAVIAEVDDGERMVLGYNVVSLRR